MKFSLSLPSSLSTEEQIMQNPGKWVVVLVSLGCHTKYYRLGDFKHFFFIVLESGKSEVKVPTCLVLDERSLSGLQKAAFSSCPHMVERQSKLSSVSSNKCINTTTRV